MRDCRIQFVDVRLRDISSAVYIIACDFATQRTARLIGNATNMHSARPNTGMDTQTEIEEIHQEYDNTV